MRFRLPGLILLLVAAVPVAAGALATPIGLVAVPAWILVVATLCIIDGYAGVRRSAYRVEREIGRRLSVGAAARVAIDIHHPAGRPARIRLRDDVPQDLHPDATSFDVELGDGPFTRFDYEIHPDRRGEWRLEYCWLEVPGRFGLTRRTIRLEAPSTVSVIPDVRALRKYDIMARRAMTESAGIRAIRRRGEGTEVESLREYVPGDDYRTIDWKATARHLDPISREMQAERNRNLVFLIDAGRWMSQPTGHLLKLDHAINSALLTAHVAERSGDLTGALAFSDRIHTLLPLARGRPHQRRLLEELHRIPADAVEPDFDRAFRELATRIRKRSLCILFSDFSDPVTAHALRRSLPVIARRHLVLCVHVLDPEVESLVGAAADDLRGLNRRAVAERLQGERRATLDGIRAGGGHVLEAHPDQLTARLVNRYLDLKARNLL